MKKWAISAIVYLLMVIGGYNVYAYFEDDNAANEPKQENGHGHSDSDAGSDSGEHGTEDGHGDSHREEGDGHGDHGAAVTDSEVTTALKAENGTLTITLTDKSGNPVDELEVNHEKLLHLIVVDSHLDGYYHLHPEKAGEGMFTVKTDLPDGSYKAFIDIKPKDLAYAVTPLEFQIGAPGDEHSHASLKPDTNLTKAIENFEVTLSPTSLKAGESITLDFELPEGAKIEPYLGAMGHVVILDESANEYVHVHPANENEPIFETKFSEPGIYKLWAEFKIEGEVRTYPFVLEIK